MLLGRIEALTKKPTLIQQQKHTKGEGKRYRYTSSHGFITFGNRLPTTTKKPLSISKAVSKARFFLLHQ